MDDGTSDACGGCVGGSMDDEACDMCGGEGGEGGGGSVDEKSHDTCRGERGGGMSMDGASPNTSGLGSGGRIIRRVGGSMNNAFGDACGGE